MIGKLKRLDWEMIAVAVALAASPILYFGAVHAQAQSCWNRGPQYVWAPSNHGCYVIAGLGDGKSGGQMMTVIVKR